MPLGCPITTVETIHFNLGINYYYFLLSQEYACLLIIVISIEGKLRKPSLKALVMIIAPWMGTPEELPCLQKYITPKVH